MKIKFTTTRFPKRKAVLTFIMKTFIFLFCTTVFSFSPGDLLSQNAKIVIDADKEVTIDEVLNIIDQQTDFSFMYKSNLFDGLPKVKLKKGVSRVNNLLKKLITNKRYNFILKKNNIVLIQKRKKETPQIQTRGNVTDNEGLPISGVTVLIKGTLSGTDTDDDGNYSLTVKNKENVLVFSYLGFKTQEIAIKNQTVINVVLQEDDAKLDEVVVIGYGKVKKEAFTGAIGTVDVDNIARQGVILNVDQALQGQVSGVQVSAPSGKPGAAARVRIRGSSSIFGTNNPLYVIDGVPISPSVETPGYTDFISDIGNNEAAGLQNEGFNNDLGFIDFNNVKSITVLKDATATAIYGSRAAAGVIVITTKDGGKSQKPQFELSTTQRFNFIEKIDVLNTSQYEEIYTEAIENYVNSGGTILTTDSFALGILAGTEVDQSVNTDWQDLVGNTTSSTSNYAFSVRGNTDKGYYFSSLSLQQDDGAIIGDKLTRYAFTLNVKQDLKDNLSFFTNTTLGRTESDFALGSVYSALSAAVFIRPDATPYDEDGNIIPLFGDTYNPISTKDRRITSTNFSMLTTLGLEYTPIENLVIKTTGILQYIDAESYSFYPSYSQSGVSSNGKGNIVTRKTFNPTIETTATYDLFLGKNKANIVVGNTFLNERTETNSYYGENFPNDDTLTGLSYAGEDISIEEAITESTLVSFFSRFVYDYDDKYLLSFAGRIDGSSKFGANNRWASFPSAGIGWNIHREEFTSNWKALNFLKLRASVGQSGNITFDPNQSFSLYGSLNSTLGVYNGDSGIVPVRIGNPDLKWEITTQKDFGVEFAFFNNSIKGEFGYYEKETKDVIYQTELASSSGLASVIGNLGDTKNSGFELSLNFNILDTNNFKWNFGFNASTAESEVVRLNSSYKDESGGVLLGGLYFQEGKALGLIRGYVADGLYQTQDEIEALNAGAPDGVYNGTFTSPGDIHFVDLDGDGEITTSDQEAIGNMEPTFFGGLNTNINYKGLSLNIFANYSLGNDIYWKAGENTFSYQWTNEQANKQTLALDRWTTENTDAMYPRAVYRTNYAGGNNNHRQSSLYTKSGDYLRIKNITLGYNLPRNVLENVNLQNFYVYITGTNLFTFTKYPGADPEYANASSFRTPSDNNNYPVVKQFTLGVRLTF